jgi:hypothetical protein
MRRMSLFLLSLFVILLSNGVTVSAQDAANNGFSVTYGGRSYNIATDQTTFTYTVSGTNVPPDLSHFDLEIPTCETALEVIAYNPAEAVSFGIDPTTGVNGIKWDLPLKMDQTRVYTITFAGDVAEGDITAAVKAGNGFKAVTVVGAACTQVGIDVVKSVSIDGGASWNDAELATGPITEIAAPVSFLIQVYNTGDFPLTNLTLTDDGFDVSSCTLPATLEVEGAFECIIGPFNAIEGQQINVATVTAVYEGATYTDSDSAYYFAGELPKITVEKFVAIANGGAWYAADTAPGLALQEDDGVSFRFVVTNEGTEEFTNITVTDSQHPITNCQIPTSLAPTESFECIIGPFGVEDEAAAFVNVVTVTAVANGQTFTVSDEAHYQMSENDDSGTVIIVEGPVEVITGSVIVIYGIEIQLADNDPLLTVIQIGDIIRVEGDLIEEGDVIIVIAVTVIIIDVDIYVIDNDLIWRDDGNCNNAPPPWAPAHGWRRKCQASNVIVIIGGGGRGMGMGMGMGDDD